MRTTSRPIRALEARGHRARSATDTLMQRAASGLAAAIAIRELIEAARRGLRPPGPGPGRPRQQRGRRPVRRCPARPPRCGGDGRPLSGPTPRTRTGGPARRRRSLDRYRRWDLIENERPSTSLAGERSPSTSSGALPADLVLDGVLGIGGRPGLPDGVGVLAGALRRRGISDDRGRPALRRRRRHRRRPERPLKATRTVTFGELKPCHLLEPAREPLRRGRAGRHRAPDRVPSPGRWLGSSRPTTCGGLALSGRAQRQVLPRRGRHRHRLRRITRVPGSCRRMGPCTRAPGWSASSARQAPADIIRAGLPNVVFSPGRVQAHLLGSGWGDGPTVAG